MFKKLCIVLSIAVFAMFCSGSALLAAETNQKTEVKTAKFIGLTPYFNSATDKGIYFELDQKVPYSEVKKMVKITPSIGYFSFEGRWAEKTGKYEICGKFVGGQKYELTIKGGLTESGEYKLVEKTESFIAAEAKSAIEFPTSCTLIELHSKQTVPLKFTHIGNFKAEFHRIPAIYGPIFDYNVVPSVDEKSYISSAGDESLNEATKEMIKNNASSFETTLDTMKKQYAQLKGMSVANLSDFLQCDFVANTQTFMGSENPDNDYFFSLPMEMRNEPEKGGYVVAKVYETDKSNAASVTRGFIVSDIALTYKFGKREMLLWVTSLETGKPLANTAVMVYAEDGKAYLPGRTDNDGIIRINENTDYDYVVIKKEATAASGKGKLEVANLRYAVAANQNDSAFIEVYANRLYAGSVPMAAPDQRSLDMVRAYAFTDRGVYRPGETVNWKAVLRAYSDGKAIVPNDIKAKVKIFDARDESIYEADLPLTPYGACSGSFQTKSFMPRGSYRIEISAISASKYFGGLGKTEAKWDRLMHRQPANATATATAAVNAEATSVFLKDCYFQVQDFEAPRHFVEMNMTGAVRKVRQIVGRDSDQNFMDCKITGKYYAGGVLRHAKVQWTAHLTEKDSSNKNFPTFCFGSNAVKKELLEQGNSVLDKNGELTVSLPVSKAVLSGLNKIEVTATVLDVDGRPATLVKSYAPVPEVRVGISKVPDGLLRGNDYPVQVIAIDKSGNRISSGEITLEVLRKRYMYTQKRAADGNGGLYYTWDEAWLKSFASTEKINNSVAEFNVSFADAGDYLLRAHYNNGKTEAVSDEVVLIEYSYSSYQDVSKNDRNRSANEIVLATEGKTASIGQNVKIKYTLPRLCDYALATLETDEILEAKVIKLDRAQGEFTMTMTEKCKPNAFVSFIAPSVRSGFPVYSIDSDTEYPRAFFGVTSFKVQNSVADVRIDICPGQNGELKALPGQNYKVDFKLTDSKGNPVVAEVAVGVVDEAVLSLTNYVTPVLNSLTDFFMPLSVFAGDIRVGLINQELFKLLSTRLLTGGGEGVGNISSDLDARKDFRPVAFWAPELVSNADGSLSVEFKLPDSMTSYRIYAVASDKESAFGSAERQLRVTKDFYIEPSVPSFLNNGDKAVVITAAHNKTDKTGTANVSVAGAEGLTATVQNGSANLGGFNTAVTKIALNADKGALNGKLVVKGDFNGNTDAVENTVTVKPASVIFSRYASGFFTGKNSFKPELPDYVASMNAMEKAGALTAHLSVASTPWTRLVPAVSYLMGYPHGCVEQTSSRIIGLAAIRNIAKEGVFKEFTVEQVDAYLKVGLENLLRMQLADGGFSYWSSDSSVCWWGTQYAAYALTVLKNSGYEFNNVYLENVLKYIKERLNSSNGDIFKEQLTALGVVSLAMNQKINSADFKVYQNKLQNAGKEAEAMLVYASAFAGDQSLDEVSFRMLSFKPMTLESRGWKYSTIRRDAFILLANAKVKGSAKISDNFAGSLFKNLTGKGYWTSTADTGIALNALAEYFKTSKPVEDSDFNVKVTTKSGTQTIKVGKAPTAVEMNPEDLTSEITFESDSASVINWNMGWTYPDVVQRSEVVDNGFTMQKTIENMNGSNEIRVGDVVKVTFIFENTDKAKNVDLDHLVIEDSIPAGFTAINTSLKNDQIPTNASVDEEMAYCDYTDGAYNFYASHKELRKDAMVAYKDYFWSGRYKLVYYLRATCEGSFVMKAPQVSLMYNPEVYGLGKASRVEILPAN